MKAIYTNTALNETYTLSGVSNIGKAWDVSKTVCERNNWNHGMFANDVKVKLV